MARLDSTAAADQIVQAPRQVSGGDAIESPDNTARSVRQIGLVSEDLGTPMSQVERGLDRLNDRRLARKYANEVLGSASADDEMSRLAAEHQELIRLKLTSGLTPQQHRRLNMVRWQLDRLRDARGGHALDALELLVAAQEVLAHRLGVFTDQVEAAARPKRK